MTETNQYSGSCAGEEPYCDCGVYDVGDVWYIEYHDGSTVSCRRCGCYFHYYANFSYSSCQSVSEENTFNLGENTCDVNNGLIDPITYQCHAATSYSSGNLLLHIFLVFVIPIVMYNDI